MKIHSHPPFKFTAIYLLKKQQRDNTIHKNTKYNSMKFYSILVIHHNCAVKKKKKSNQKVHDLMNKTSLLSGPQNTTSKIRVGSEL